MSQCIFLSCKFRPDDRVGNIALVHRFPQQEHLRMQWVQWVREKCDMPTFEYTPKVRICYRHFKRHCYHQSNGLLKPFSYPAFTPRDLDSIYQYDKPVKDILMEGSPKTSLIINIDPEIFKQSVEEKTGPGKKIVLMVTDKGTPKDQPSNSIVHSISQNDAGACLIRPQDIPPLRYINREESAKVIHRISIKQHKTISLLKNRTCAAQSQLPTGGSCQSPASNIYNKNQDDFVCQNSVSIPCKGQQQSISKRQTDFSETSCGDVASRSPPSANLMQTLLNSSRRRTRMYERRLQLEKNKMSKIKEFLEKMKKEQLISVAVAEKFEAILNDE